MNELEPIPHQVSHIYALVSAGKRFSAFIPTSPEGQARYLAACELLLPEAQEASVHGLRWFRENPKFSEHHAALEDRVERCLQRRGREILLVRESECDAGRQIVWRQDRLEGLFRCGVVMVFAAMPAGLEGLLSSMDGPHVVQGANEALRPAMAKAKRLIGEGKVSLLFRGGEVEIYAPEPELRRAFNMACRVGLGT
jgi:hypothetical protein